MTQEQKQLLLVDLCARLPYGVIVKYKSMKGEGAVKLGYGNITYVSTLGRGWWTECKPYLRPMSSMTEKEKEDFGIPFTSEGLVTLADTVECMDWLNAHHLDYRGLIPMGLALSAKEGMYNIK